LTIKKDLHANFRICLSVLFAKRVGTVAWKEIQRDKVMGVDDANKTFKFLGCQPHLP
jgi:hypothetical protein